MSWAAVAIGGGAVLGAAVSSIASSNAANSQSQASQYATDAQLSSSEQSIAAQLEAAGMSADAALEAAKIQAESANYATDKQWEMYQQTRSDQLPWMKAGQQALGTLQQKIAAGPGEFTESPGYQFRLDQGNKNILANSAATGNLASGRTLKALESYGQDYASNEYQNFLNQYYQSLAPLQSLAGVGQSSATTIGQAGTSAANSVAGIQSAYGSQVGQSYGNLANVYGNLGNNLASTYQNTGNAMAQNIMNQGNISATNSINQSNAWTNAINQGISSYMMGSAMKLW